MYKILILLLLPMVVQSKVFNYKVKKDDNLSTIIYSSSSDQLNPKVKEMKRLNLLKDENYIQTDQYLKLDLNLLHCNIVIDGDLFSIKELVVNKEEKDLLCIQKNEKRAVELKYTLNSQLRIGFTETIFNIGNSMDVLYGKLISKNGKSVELISEYKNIMFNLKLAQMDIENSGVAKVSTDQLNYYKLRISMKQDSEFYLGLGLQFNNLYRISSDTSYNLYFEKQKELGLNLIMGYDGFVSILSEASVFHNLEAGLSYSGKIGGSLNFKYISIYSDVEYINRDDISTKQNEITTTVGLGFNF